MTHKTWDNSEVDNMEDRSISENDRATPDSGDDAIYEIDRGFDNEEEDE